MSELQLIESALAVAAQRRRRERAFRGLWQGLFIGAAVWLLALGIYKLLPVPVWTLGTAAVLGFASVLAGLLIGGWHRNSVSETARWVDGRQHLQERLSTALEMAKSSGNESWRELLVADAASHVKELDARRLVQFRLPRSSRWAMLLLALAAGLGFVPEYRSKNYLQKQADAKVIQDVGQHLVDLTKQNLKARPPVLETTQKSMEAVNNLGDQFTKKAMTRNEALKDLAKITDKLKEDMKESMKEPALKRLEQAARANGGDTSPEQAKLQKQIEDAQKQLGDNNATPDQMDKLNKDLAKLQEAAKAAQDKNGGMSDAMKEQLSQSLAALSKQAQDQGMKLPDLDQAMQALAAGQTGMFLKDMEASVNDLEKMKELSKSLQSMQQQMEKMGKDLAEQLQNGQPQAAQATLQKMIDQLKAANLSPEQLDKMMAEVSKAIDPAGKYGKVGDFLKQAAQQMKAGQKPGAAQSLADASKELERLLQQMGDAQSMMAELDALNKAAMAVGTCQSWGTCNKPGFNPHGGKPGSGVGTWAAEDSGWGYNGAQTERYDNSGITRPDMASKGLTDRGAGEAPDSLKPSQVKGQFSPGGQMPSITLKGVSIKGTSKVSLEEAAVTAQQEAQSALSQEKVPRAYQGAVRDYFDEIKK
jgi:hypothetical protein